MKVQSAWTPCLLALLVLHICVQPTTAWKAPAKPASNSPSSKAIWNFFPPQPEEQKQRGSFDRRFVQGTIESVKPFAKDIGIWSALAWLGFDYLCKRPGQIGQVATRAAGCLRGLAQFPGVAFTLCFLFSVDLQNKEGMLGDRGWDWFWRSYVVYLFRFFLQSKASLLQYALEGAVGLSAAIKVVRHIMLST